MIRLFYTGDEGSHAMGLYVSFIFYRLSYSGLWGGQEPIPDALGWKAGYTLDKSPPHHRANTDRQTTIHTHIQTLRTISELCANQPVPQVHVFGGGRKPEYPERTHAVTGRTCKLLTERP